MISMTIDGSRTRASETYGVVNPASGAVLAQAPSCSLGQLDEAMAAACRAFGRWQLEESDRRDCLRQAAEIVLANAEELGRLITEEQGKPLAKAVREVRGAAAGLSYAAAVELAPEVVRDRDPARVEVCRRALGVVAAITPWNYPVIVAANKIASALRMGNTVVLKPSPFAPLATLRMGELLQAVFPPGVLNVVSGGDELGRAMVRHPTVRKISFTGSIAAGKDILAGAAGDLKRVTLELGGNDAAIVLDDVDPAVVAPKIFWGAFQNSGQVCSAIKRLYIHERVYAPLAESLTRIAASVRVRNGLDREAEMGPISTGPQLERVTGLVADARRAGGRVRIGGERVGSTGYFFAPTLIEELGEESRLVCEEQFGPVLPLSRFSDVDDAVARANATRFGLSGSVWSGSVARARAVAARLECGTAWVNQHLIVLPEAPICGRKWSGLGVEGGVPGLLEFSEIQTLMLPAQ